MLLSEFKSRVQFKFTGIYKIENIVNNHVYIGQAKNIGQRIAEHIHDFKVRRYSFPLYKAIEKYGLSKFTFEVLEHCDLNKLNEREIYWIKYYKANSSRFGYNCTAGGKGGHKSKLTIEQVIEIKNTLFDLKEVNSDIFKSLGNRYNVTYDLIYRINTGRVWFDPDIKYPIAKVVYKQINYYQGYAVAQVDISTNKVLKLYPSVNKAAIDLKLTCGNIGRCISGQRKTAYGYYWHKIDINYEDWLKL